MSSPSEKVRLLACLPLLVLLVFPSISACSKAKASITLATTTSTYDSGLLGELIPPFEKEQSVTVKVVAVGTGQALALGERGDADVLLVHDPQAEEDFMAKGLGEVRRRVMYNDFIIVGPPQDPAGIRGMKDAAQALSSIAQAGVPFVSRGDNSGTYSKEKALWKKAGITPEGAWYLSAGQGMGETLNLAREKGAYTLSDRATFLAQGKPGLEVLVEGDPALQNIYHVILVKGLSGKEAELARKLTEYFTSAETQERIASFGVEKYGQRLFFPYPE